MKTKFDIWKEYWDDLDDDDKLNIYRDYLQTQNSDDEFWPFDEEFFEIFFSSSEALEVARAVYFGNIESWNDEYIRFNGYGNLESLTPWKLVEEANDNLSEIFDHERCWNDVIDEDEIESELREYCYGIVKETVLKVLPDLSEDLIEDQFDCEWCDEDTDLEEVSQAIIDYYSDPENL